MSGPMAGSEAEAAHLKPWGLDSKPKVLASIMLGPATPGCYKLG